MSKVSTDVTTIQNLFWGVQQITVDEVSVSWRIHRAIFMVIEQFFQEEITHLILRVCDCTNGDVGKLQRVHKINIAIAKSKWTLKGLKQERVYELQLGAALGDQLFIPILAAHQLCWQKGSLIVNQVKNSKNKNHWEENVSTYSYYE